MTVTRMHAEELRACRGQRRHKNFVLKKMLPLRALTTQSSLDGALHGQLHLLGAMLHKHTNTELLESVDRGPPFP